MGISCFQIDQIPDLSLNKYQSLADTGIDGVLKRHDSFLRQWHGICTESSTSFHLLYCYLPSEPFGQRLKAYFIIQGNEGVLRLIEPLLQKSPLSDFFVFKKGILPQIHMNAGSTLIKKERLADIYNPLTGQSKSIHYVPKWEMNNKARLYDLFRIMDTVSQAYFPQGVCAFRIDMYPVSTAQDTRSRFSSVLKDLRGENDIKLLKETDSLKSNNYARDICKEYEDWITNIETTPHFRVNIYGFASDTFKSKIILNSAGSEAINEGDFSIAAIKPDPDGTFSLLSRMGEKAEDYCFFPSQAVLRSWSTTYCLSEVVPFFRFPTLYDGETIEIPKETFPVQIKDGIYLGEDVNGYPVNIALKDLPRHAFFTGMPGSGKTNTMLHLVSQLHQKGIPFLALEPAKKEYRSLLGYEEMLDIYLFSPHLQSKFPLQMNPMAFPAGVRLSEHINALLEVFEGSFSLEGPTRKFLSNSIQRSYTNLGWDIEDENTEDSGLPYPTLQDIYNNLEKEIDASNYDGELKGNIRSFLQVRLGGLMERDAGELFNVRKSTIKPEEWLNISAIVELEVLGEQAKSFFVLLVCHYILETLRANSSGGVYSNGTPMPVRHVVFIEEAHNIIASSTRQESSSSVDPKISATAYIVKMLAEVRALREAIVIADQLPTALASEVTKNTGLKLVHRLTSQDDREQIGLAISASPMQLERMASFTSGRAFIYHERTLKPFEMQVAEWIHPAVTFDTSNDFQLYAQTWLISNMEHAITVAFDNWLDKYYGPIEDAQVELLKQFADAIASNNVVGYQCCLARKEILLNECQQLFVKCNRLKKLWFLSETDAHPLHYNFEELLASITGIIDRLNVIKQIF